MRGATLAGGAAALGRIDQYRVRGLPGAATPCCVACAAWANAGRPSSPATGATSVAAPQAPPGSALSPSSSPISSTADSPESRRDHLIVTKKPGSLVIAP